MNCQFVCEIVCAKYRSKMREIVHIQAGQCGNQIGAKVSVDPFSLTVKYEHLFYMMAE